MTNYKLTRLLCTPVVNVKYDSFVDLLPEAQYYKKIIFFNTQIIKLGVTMRVCVCACL